MLQLNVGKKHVDKQLELSLIIRCSGSCTRALSICMRCGKEKKSTEFVHMRLFTVSQQFELSPQSP